jgi:hypothetical protein
VVARQVDRSVDRAHLSVRRNFRPTVRVRLTSRSRRWRGCCAACGRCWAGQPGA